jgi:hypothetical protein
MSEIWPVTTSTLKLNTDKTSETSVFNSIFIRLTAREDFSTRIHLETSNLTVSSPVKFSSCDRVDAAFINKESTGKPDRKTPKDQPIRDPTSPYNVLHSKLVHFDT